jgi:hypothetical protein
MCARVIPWREQLWVDGADDGSHVDPLGSDIAVDRCQMSYPVPSVIDTFNCPFELLGGSGQMWKCFAERFIPESLPAGVVVSRQDEAPGSGGHRRKDVLVERFLAALWPAFSPGWPASPRIRFAAIHVGHCQPARSER